MSQSNSKGNFSSSFTAGLLVDVVVVFCVFGFLVGFGALGFFVGFGGLGFFVGFGGFGFFVGLGFLALASFSAAFFALACKRKLRENGSLCTTEIQVLF